MFRGLRFSCVEWSAFSNVEEKKTDLTDLYSCTSLDVDEHKAAPGRPELRQRRWLFKLSGGLHDRGILLFLRDQSFVSWAVLRVMVLLLLVAQLLHRRKHVKLNAGIRRPGACAPAAPERTVRVRTYTHTHVQTSVHNREVEEEMEKHVCVWFSSHTRKTKARALARREMQMSASSRRFVQWV